MCGFVGLVNWQGLQADLPLLHRCRDSLSHRGPDSAGYFLDDTTYLGFRRLAILDLSPQGDQPMATEDEQVWIVFNGEIYNYVELRRDLGEHGQRFRGTSDTEVLLRLYCERGTEMFDVLNGMFAFAIYDRRQRSIILARDRLGKKPLFYWLNHHGLGFASEIRALRRLPGFPCELDRQAIGLYLRLGWVPNWTCIYPGVSKLPPGHWLRYDIATGQIEGPVPFWSLPPVNVDEGYSEEYWLDRIESLLLNATRIRLRADVPLGVFLSGGIDSGLVAAAAARERGGDLTSLTISFPQWADDETPLARATAQHLGIRVIVQDLQVDGLETLPTVMGHFDEPFADSSALPTSLVSATARQHFTVILSGDGGDESFAGYENHVRAWQWRYVESVPVSWRRSLADTLTPLTRPDSRTRRFLRRLAYPVGTWGIGSKLYLFEDWLSSCIRPEYQLTGPEAVQALDERIERWPTAACIDQAQRNDIRLYMLDDILVKVDRMSMCHSLEVRSPFLDYRMVELALCVPPALRTRHGRNKYLLRRLAERYLPSTVVSAPKRGFAIPLGQWIFASQYSRTLKELLLSPVSNVPDPLLAGGGERLWAMAKDNEALLTALFRLLAYRWWSEGLAREQQSCG